MTTVLDHGIIAEELALERDARERGVARYRRLVRSSVERGQGASLRPVERLMVGWFAELSRLVSIEQDECLAGVPSPGRREYGPYVGLLDADRIASITMHTVLSMCLKEPGGASFTSVALAIGRNVCSERQYAAIRAEKGDPWTALVRTSRKGITPENIAKIANRFNVLPTWPRRVRARMGAAFIDLMRRAAFVPKTPSGGQDVPALTIESPYFSANRTRRVVKLSESALAQIEYGHDFRQMLRPRHEPMVVRPIKWAEGARGGYYETAVQFVIPKHGAKKQCVGEVAIDGINALNGAAFRINRDILRVVEALADEGGNVVGLPRMVDIPLPPMPDDELDAQTRRAVRRRRAEVYRKNVNIHSDRTNFAHKMDIAARMAGYPRLWFPHCVDFRGRAYPVPLHLNIQGDDVCRGLLEFADGKQNEASQAAIMVHLAGCCGVDKVGYDDRIEYVRDTWDEVMGWARDPMMNVGWMKADEPFQALAAAMALRDPEHGVRLPVKVDGSNNALQHYGAMLRCRETAALTNLCNSDRPADGYASVAERVARQVESDCLSRHPFAPLFDGVITRKIVKQTTMTTAYSVTRFGAKKQLHEHLLASGFTWPEDMADADRSRALGYLADVVMAEVRAVFPAADRAMQWLTDVARVIVAAGRTLSWETPTGFVVTQPYRKTLRNSCIRTVCGKMQLPVRSKHMPSPRRQINGMAPNFVHSLDAAHLMLTACACEAAGIDIAAVHDGYFTHAATVGQMGWFIRESFVQLHERPALDALHGQLSAQHPDLALPEPPRPGELDINCVLSSDYFFA